MALDSKLFPERDPDDPSFAQPKRIKRAPPRDRGEEITAGVMIGIGVIAVVLAVIHPGYDWPIILLGGALASWGSFVLLTRP